MKPAVNINLNEVFANTTFLEELGTVIFGAELALSYMNASDAQVTEIKGKIVRSAFASFSLRYDNMSAAAQSLSSAPSSSPNPAAPAAAETPFFSEPSSSTTDYNYISGQPDIHENEPDISESSAQSYQTPPSTDSDANTDDGFEQTVVYENYPDSTEKSDFASELPNGFESATENTWESDDKLEENTGFGQIRWTTYNAAAKDGDEH